MAKKRAPKVNATLEMKKTPVRLDLDATDHERLERWAKRYGLNKSSYVRMALFERMESEEKREGGR